MARVLIIGGSGFVGSALCEELSRLGHAVTSLSRGRMPVSQHATSLVADRAEPAAVRTAIGDRVFDLVIDTCTYTADDARNALSAIQGRCGHYVFISTDFVYVAHDDLRLPIDEHARTHTQTPYAAGKLAAEQVFREAFERDGFPITTLRPPHVLGAGKNLGSDFTSIRDGRILDKLRAGTGTTLLEGGQLLLQPVWHREIAWCCDAIAGKRSAMGEVFNLAGPDCITTRRYYQLIADALQVPLKFESVSLDIFTAAHPDRAPMTRHRIYSTEKLTRLTGYQPRGRVEDAIQETLQWMLRREQNPGGGI